MKKLIILGCLLLLMNHASKASSWESELENYRDLMAEKTYHLFHRNNSNTDFY